jgi:hypothetical protein
MGVTHSQPLRSSVASSLSTAGIAFSVAVLVCHLRWPLRHHKAIERVPDGKHTVRVFSAEEVGSAAEEAGQDAHSIKSRVGNFKKSKLKNLVEGIGADCGYNVDFNMSDGTAAIQSKSKGFDNEALTGELTELEQIAAEQRIVQEAIRLIQIVRSSGVPRQLPHSHVLRTQLQTAELQLAEILDNVDSFWRYGREEPMADLLCLPIMQLAARNETKAIVPLPLPKECKAFQTPLESDLSALRVEEDASLQEVESVYRRNARDMHKQGQCLDIEAFHQLQTQYDDRRFQRSSWQCDIHSSDDILAHYFLIGTDPKQSRYREYSSGLLDVPSRGKLLSKIEVLINWGETSGSATGLGNG